jgi:hypothetical protein
LDAACALAHMQLARAAVAWVQWVVIA